MVVTGYYYLFLPFYFIFCLCRLKLFSRSRSGKHKSVNDCGAYPVQCWAARAGILTLFLTLQVRKLLQVNDFTVILHELGCWLMFFIDAVTGTASPNQRYPCHYPWDHEYGRWHSKGKLRLLISWPWSREIFGFPKWTQCNYKGPYKWKRGQKRSSSGGVSPLLSKFVSEWCYW